MNGSQKMVNPQLIKEVVDDWESGHDVAFERKGIRGLTFH
jgi:hypothetical protein